MKQYLMLRVLLVVILRPRLTEGCTCQPTHPHIQFCSADYVVRVKVTSKETIYPDKVETTTAPPTSDGQSAVELAPWLNEPLSAARRGPPGLIEYSPFSGLTDPNRPVKIIYTVYIEKIYKGDNFISPKQFVKIKTSASDGLCGVTYLATRERYILSGKVVDGELNMILCDYIQRYSEITRRQKQGLKYHWKKGCGDCNVGVCYGQYCPSHLITDNCMLDIAPTEYQCEIDFARCTRNERGDCTWYGKKDFRECQSQRALSKSRSLPFQP
ncbi:metalloproteinase inhibitor 3-like [Apostichopus japonicus]|uniref:metalloproteinase inhibitor 3-like n=1 Tax=Stichopus japonicus TaxID=307972 RepID=UPI003AB90D03